MPAESQQDTPLDPSHMPDVIDEPSRDSITDVHGTIARFEMAYTPEAGDRFAFGPPLRTRLPSYAYLAVALISAAVVGFAYASPSGTRLFHLVVEGDRHRILSSTGWVLILVASAIGTVIRTHMRGVIVNAQGVEVRTLLPLGIPRVRAFAWPQVDRMIVDDRYGVMLELWDGRYEKLPPVAEPMKLASLLQQIAVARHMRVTRLEKL